MRGMRSLLRWVPRLQRGPGHLEIVVVDRRPSLAKDRKVADRGFTGRFHSPRSSTVTVGFAVTMPLQLFQEHEQSFRQGPRQLILRPDSLAELRPNGAVRGIVVVNSTGFHGCQPCRFAVVPRILQFTHSKYFARSGQPLVHFSLSWLHSTGDCAAPTVSAIVAPRAPSGFSLPTVVSRAV